MCMCALCTMCIAHAVKRAKKRVCAVSCAHNAEKFLPDFFCQFLDPSSHVCVCVCMCVSVCVCVCVCVCVKCTMHIHTTHTVTLCTLVWIERKKEKKIDRLIARIDWDAQKVQLIKKMAHEV